MATQISKMSFLRFTSIRNYGQVVPVSGTVNYEIKNTILPNKIVVSSAENDSAITRISIVFRAGSRYENADNAGVTHALRICAGLTTKSASQFAIIRNVQQVGGSITCTSDRETISYTLQGTRGAIEKSLPFLTEIATQQVFKAWEVNDNVSRMRLELALRPPQLRAVDLLHKAAFRRGLGNSLYSAKYNLGRHSSETLQDFFSKHCTTDRCAVVGLGVDHSELVNYAQALKLHSGDCSTEQSVFRNAEIRSDKGGHMAYIALAGEGRSIKNTKDAIACAVLQRILGTGPQVKWGQHDNGLISKCIGSSLCQHQYATSAFNINYSDAGLLGVLIAAPSEIAGTIIDGTLKALQTTSISEDELKRGKNQLKTSILLDAENGIEALEEIGRQASILGGAKSSYDIASTVDTITQSDVNNILKKLSSRLSIASYGNLRTVPFLTDLK